VTAVVGKTAKQMNEEHQAWVDAQPRTAGCAFCGWSFEATDRAEADQAFAAHRQAEHPETLGRRSRRRRSGTFLLGARTAREDELRSRELAARVAADHARKAAARS
jgi:hypothetical protein